MKELLRKLAQFNTVSLGDMEKQIEDTKEFVEMNKQLKEVYAELKGLKVNENGSITSRIG